MPKIPFYIPYGYNEEQDYDSKRGLIEKKLEQSEKNDEEEFSSISAISGSMSSELIANAVYDSDLKSLVFYNSKNEAIASIPVSDIVVSGLIQEAYYDKETKKIVIVFENGDTIEIDVSDVIDIDEAGDGLVSEDGTIKVLIDPESDDYLTVSSGGVKVAGVDAAISAAVADEQARAEGVESGLADDIAAEETRATGAETTLNQLISAEKTRAMSKEDELANTIANETSRAEGEEGTIKIQIVAEYERAVARENALEDMIEAEEGRATSAETVLNEKIDAETARAEAAEAAISGAVEDEQARAEAAEQALSGLIADEQSRAEAAEQALDAETARAEAAEQVLSGMVADEQTRAEAAESGLQDAIDAEEARAISAETALDERIDGILDGLDYQDTAVVGQYVSEVDETSGVVSVSRVNVSDAPLNGYVSVMSQEEYAGATIDEVNKITSADTINNAFNKVEKIIIADEIVTASGFSKLNQDIADEIERASGSEATISAAVVAETTRATDAESALSTSIANEVARATSAETTIDTKVNTQVVANASYDSNAKLIIFTNLNSGTVATINATDFVKDGMIDNVEIKDVVISGESVTCLVITFNTDSGKEEIDIPISDIFDASNYYTKDETDQQIGEAISGLDFSDSAVSGKYVSEVSETDGIVSVSRLNVSEAPLNNFESVFDDPEYTYATANEEDKIEATDTINQAFNKIERIIIADELVFSASDNALNNKIIAETDRATSAETALGASITAVDGKFANVYTKSQTSGKTELSAEFAKCITSAQVNTLIATAIDGLDYADTAVTGQYVAKVDEANGVVSMTRANVAEAPLNGFTSLYNGAEFSAVTANEANKIASGDTINQAFNKIEATIADNEYVTSAALNDLNDKIAAETDRAEAVEIALSGVVSGLTGEYYTKSETSSKTEISVAFANYYTKSETSSSTEIAEALSHAGEVTSADVETMISTAINGLDFTDVEVSGQYISKVDEVDGLVSVARKNVVDANLIGYSALTVSDEDISDLDTIVSAIKKLVAALEKNEYVIASALNELNTRVTALENT